ncbi:AzlD domain-containing protein [Geodermatophilus sp. DSM 44513]|uniref:AzlD domain-containing protein n=1 Tax=Geodermatophilus sp. DSM 44513 TaxID=1528104 RepID=UPI001411C574|nr:AzlD domain-containing protein [Geodermatophilus sp. DSM 44513]WNV73678.1 AzlD domain-containing protein [Geodermatophilus sp. DSM 44513]
MSAATVWALVVLCALGTALIRGVGPAATGDRALPAPVVRVVVLLSAALLAALVVTTALADGDRPAVGADTAGVAVAGLLLWRRAPVLVAVLAAVVVTAGLRAAGVA